MPKLPKLIRRLDRGELIPRFYGVAYCDMVSQRATVAPVPLNIIIHLVVNLWAFLRWGYMPISDNPRLAFDQGYRKGKKENAQDPRC